MRIFIMRHGESQATLDPTSFERYNPPHVPLSRWGHNQSVDAGNALRELYEEEPSLNGRKLRIYYSPYLRIVQTKDGVQEGLGTLVAQACEEPLLEERKHGLFDGVVNEEARRRIAPEICDALHSSDPETRYKVKLPEGESLEEVVNRAQEFLDRLLREAKEDEDILIITHGMNFKALEMLLSPKQSGKDIRWFVDTPPPNTGDILQVDVENGVGTHMEMVHEGFQRQHTILVHHMQDPWVGRVARTTAENARISER